jgi:aminoglycoside N3'-acetyltransferase
VSKRLNKQDLIKNFLGLGVGSGDVILIRASLGAVGRITGGAQTFIDALLEVVGEEGTVVSLAFTSGSFLRKPRKEDAFHSLKESYAGALPNEMIKRADSFRSRHPMCSYVAIGKNAKEITEGHDHNSPAYEPIRKIVELQGKNILIGCVGSSPGFTTTHLAEQDLGMLKIPMLSRFVKVFYINDNAEYKIFQRKDPGLCSSSFYKFYAHYVKEGVLNIGFVGNAYSILAPAKECYDIDRSILSIDKKFNICDSADCFMCNFNRRDRVYRIPGYIARYLWKRLQNKL